MPPRRAPRPGDGHDIGEVFLALGVVGAEAGEGVTQQCCVEGVDPGVDLGDRALGVGGVLLLDDPQDRSVRVPDDPAIACGIGDP